MTDALMPEEASFLRKSPTAPKGESKPRAERASAVGKTTPSSMQNGAAQNQRINLSGTVNNRIDVRITQALLRASVDRKIEQQSPWLQRDIISEALTEWLESRGYSIGR